jgi:hypothetical protein
MHWCGIACVKILPLMYYANPQITTKSHKQWKLLLECQVEPPKTPGWEAVNMGFEVVDSHHCIVNQSGLFAGDIH